jgi:hypothetical protein
VSIFAGAGLFASVGHGACLLASSSLQAQRHPHRCKHKHKGPAECTRWPAELQGRALCALRYYRFMHTEKDNMADILENVSPLLRHRIAYQVCFMVAYGLPSDLVTSQQREGRLPGMFSGAQPLLVCRASPHRATQSMQLLLIGCCDLQVFTDDVAPVVLMPPHSTMIWLLWVWWCLAHDRRCTRTGWHN